VTFGLVILYSASYPLGVERFQDGSIYLRKQVFFLFIGILAMVFAIKVPYRYWRRVALPLLGFSTLLLMLVYFPGIGFSAGGAHRWLDLGGIRFQPAELAKFSLIIYLASSMWRKQDRMKDFSIGILPHLLIPSVLLILILLQPDFGTFFTLMCLILCMLFVGGARIKHLLAMALAFLPIFYFLILRVGYRRKRFMAFLDPWADQQDSGFQIIQSQIAFHEGGLHGVGLGEGQQKMLFVPDVHTDFVFSVVGEELGFLGVALFVILYLGFTILGLGIAMKAYRAGATFACYLATGLTLMVAVPAFMNMAVVLGILPTKGMVLPFLSYGGSALLIVLLGSGILLNLSRR